MSAIQTGTIQQINLKDDDVNKVYSVKALLDTSANTLVEVFPIDTNIKRVPILGEQIIVLNSKTADSNSKSAQKRKYYSHIIPVQSNVHNNSLPTANSTNSTTSGGDYGDTSAGNPNSSGGESDADLGDGFVERTDVGSLQPFLGDVLIEGRFGHSLRFGYYTTEDPSWESSTVEDPISILSNGRKSGGSYNKFIIESADDDLSSIYLTSSQKISLKTSQTNLGMGVDVQSKFDKPSVIITSDRILLDSKSDYVILSGAKDIINATPSWEMEMDKMFTILEGLIQQVADLTAGTATFATGVGPTGPATNVAD